MTKRLVIVIPARYGSSRLPGKPLADILGKPMVQHVYEAALKVPEAEAVIVATDDKRVQDAVVGFGGQCIMTSAEHPSGTDRLVEVMGSMDADIYLNVQGDEPLVRAKDLSLLAQAMLASESPPVGTLCHAIDAQEADNPNIVKVVVDHAGYALYFSRSLIPYPREKAHAHYLKHVGVYAYSKQTLATYADLPASPLEASEVLEQLRLMSAGIRLKVLTVAPTGPGVDTQEGLEQVRAILNGKPYAAPDPLAKVRLLITDVDGVLTDGGLFYNASGEALKRFHVRDGLGIKLLQQRGVQVAVLSGRDSAVLRKRIADLGVTLFSLGAKDKAAECERLQAIAGVNREQTACIGDDSIDLRAFSACGLSYAVADAPDYVKRNATGVLSLPGGSGALRELADRILRAQGAGDVLESAHAYASVMNQVVQ
ncbi:3-deoxy-manno-octulosonate cytidylyltransferase [Lampropedia cohaerens]|uniref:3-deoxy-manno-octulosonate cytidylyltransferase n=1 Tax=Lampropedia cohaerens TaxID=1610491 RepID=UPI000ACE78E1|nr:3-deoxy-manno-octulosonate cytidylyltransferase [Lampropedia cohaerens]